MNGHLTDQIAMNKGQFMEYITELYVQYVTTNYPKDGGDLINNLNIREELAGFREYICREIMELE